MTATPSVFTAHGSGGGLAALSYTCAVDTAVAAGTGAVVQSTIRYLASQPGAPSMTDTKGNTWTRTDDGGNSLVPLTTFFSNCANGLTTSDTLTITYTTNNCDSITVAGVQTVGSSIARSGVVGGVLSIASSTTHAYTGIGNAAPDLVISGDSISGADQTAYTSTTGATFLQVVGSSTNRALVQIYAIPGDTASHTKSNLWGSAHVGSMNNVHYVTTLLANTGTGSITLGGTGTAKGAGTASGSITLGGTAANVVQGVTGSLTLGGTAATVVIGITGSLSLSATASSVVLGITGSVTLSGSATGNATGTATGSVTLTGNATGNAATTATGSLTLTGSGTAASGSAGTSATGSITLTGSATGAAVTVASGSLVLTGAVTGRASGSANGTLTLAGSLTAAATASATGSITLAGSATAASTAAHTTPTPTGRVIHIPADNRVIRIPSETRVITIPPAGSRVILVTA